MRMADALLRQGVVLGRGEQQPPLRDRSHPGSTTFALAKYAYIGSDHNKKKENVIDFLKGCQVAKAMGNWCIRAKTWCE